MVERNHATVEVASSKLAFRSRFSLLRYCATGQMIQRTCGLAQINDGDIVKGRKPAHSRPALRSRVNPGKPRPPVGKQVFSLAGDGGDARDGLSRFTGLI